MRVEIIRGPATRDLENKVNELDLAEKFIYLKVVAKTEEVIILRYPKCFDVQLFDKPVQPTFLGRGNFNVAYKFELCNNHWVLKIPISHFFFLEEDSKFAMRADRAERVARVSNRLNGFFFPGMPQAHPVLIKDEFNKDIHCLLTPFITCTPTVAGHYQTHQDWYLYRMIYIYYWHDKRIVVDAFAKGNLLPVDKDKIFGVDLAFAVRATRIDQTEQEDPMACSYDSAIFWDDMRLDYKDFFINSAKRVPRTTNLIHALLFLEAIDFDHKEFKALKELDQPNNLLVQRLAYHYNDPDFFSRVGVDSKNYCIEKSIRDRVTALLQQHETFLKHENLRVSHKRLFYLLKSPMITSIHLDVYLNLHRAGIDKDILMNQIFSLHIYEVLILEACYQYGLRNKMLLNIRLKNDNQPISWVKQLTLIFLCMTKKSEGKLEEENIASQLQRDDATLKTAYPALFPDGLIVSQFNNQKKLKETIAAMVLHCQTVVSASTTADDLQPATTVSAATFFANLTLAPPPSSLAAAGVAPP